MRPHGGDDVSTVTDGNLDLRAVVADTGEFVAAATTILGVSRRTVERWLVGGVDWNRADRIAVKVFGVHPIDVWGDAWVELADEYAALAEAVLYE